LHILVCSNQALQIEYREVQKFLQRYRYSIILLKQLVKTDFKLRYQGSVLGYVWSLLRPLFMFAILYVIFGVVLLGIVLWNYFSEVTTGSVGAIVGKGDLLRKINFPKYVIILAGSLSALINLALNFVVIAILMFYKHVPLTWHALIIIPLIAELFVISIALAFILSALYVKFRDVTYIWEVFMQAGFYATPILYPLIGSFIPARAAKYVLLNPMAQIIQDSRHVLVTPVSPIISDFWGGDKLIWAIPLALSFGLLVVGGVYFRNRSKFFAEDI
jgi:ABC-2 type transport system permease protein